MIQLRKLLLAHSMRAIKHPDGREADGFYEIDQAGVALRDKNDAAFAFISASTMVIQTLEPVPGRQGRWRGIGFLGARTADLIGIDRDSDDIGRIGRDFLFDCGHPAIRNDAGNVAFVLLYTTLAVPPESPPEVFHCEAASSADAIRKLYAEVPGALNVQHSEARDLDRALARWETPSAALA